MGLYIFFITKKIYKFVKTLVKYGFFWKKFYRFE